MLSDSEQWLATNPAPGFAKYPEHEVACEAVRGEIVCEVDGVTIARSNAAVLVTETNHLPVYYIPEQDIEMELLTDSAHVSRCPFKGKARYWNVRISDHEIDNAAWSYETPYDEVLELAGLIAFYASKVTITKVDTA